MKNKFYLILLSLLVLSNYLNAQVGIGTAAPDAQLDIRSSSIASPINTDGILIPRVSTLTASGSMTAAQQGMLVYLTATYSGNEPGFYFWDNSVPSWIGITSTANGDKDWYKEGTTTAPTLITDDMFHTGNVAIGKNTADYPLDILTTNNVNGIYNQLNNNTNAGIKVGIINNVSDTSTDSKVGLQNSVASNGNVINTVGISNLVSSVGTQLYGTSNTLSGSNATQSNLDGTRNTLSIPTGANNIVNGVYNILTPSTSGFFNGVNNLVTNSNGGIVNGVYNQFSGTTTSENNGVFSSIATTSGGDVNGINNLLGGDGTVNGLKNNLVGSQAGNKFGVVNTISNSGNGAHYGVQNNLSGTGTGLKTGIQNNLSGTSNGTQTAIENAVSNTGTGVHYGTFNTLSGTGTGQQFGNYTTITNSGLGTQYGSAIFLNATTASGIRNGYTVDISNNATGTNTGFSSYLTGAGAGTQRGIVNNNDNSGAGFHYGTVNILSGTGNGDQYGNQNILSATGTGAKIGSYSLINTTAGGAHYGVYSEVLKAGATNFAGYFLGNVGIGTAAANTYTLPSSRGTVGQIMRTDASGNVTWANNSDFAWSLNGNSITATDFIGTTNAQPLIFKTSNAERMRVIATGEVVVGNTTAAVGDKFSSYATGTQIAVNGYSTLSGIGVFGTNSGTGYGMFGQSASTGTGVFGTNNNTGVGVYGINSGTGNGVRGESATTGRGVIGFNTGAGIATQGQNSSTGAGVFGINTSTGVGVQGQSGNLDANAIVGLNTTLPGTGLGIGVLGQTSQSNGLGVFGINNGPAGISFGYAFGDSRVSVYGNGRQTGSFSFGVLGDGGSSTRSGGVFGDDFGIARGSLGYFNSALVDYAVYGFGAAYQTGTIGGRPARSIANDEPNNMVGLGIYGGVMGGWVRGLNYGLHAKGNEYGMYVDGNTITNKPIIQLIDNGKEKRSISFTTTSMTADVYVRGNDKLSNGSTYVTFKENFSAIVSDKIPMNITITPTGASKGVYVTDISNKGFRVVENDNGNSNVSINWVAYGTRLGYENTDEIISDEIISSKFDENMDAVMYNDTNKDGKEKGIWFDGTKVQTGKTPSIFQQLKLNKKGNKEIPKINTFNAEIK